MVLKSEWTVEYAHVWMTTVLAAKMKLTVSACIHHGARGHHVLCRVVMDGLAGHVTWYLEILSYVTNH